MTNTESGASESAPWLARLRASIPFALTALVAVAASLFAQFALFGPTPSASVPPQPTALAVVTAVSLPTSQPFATALPLTESISRQEIADLQAEVDRLWTVNYLSRALIQLADAESALRSNDWPSANQSLIAVDDSLMLSHQRADDSVKNPIEQLRVELDRTWDDLHVQPEAADTNLLSLRQKILALVEARRSDETP